MTADIVSAGTNRFFIAQSGALTGLSNGAKARKY